MGICQSDKPDDIDEFDKYNYLPYSTDIKNIPVYVPKFTYGRVIKVYDGDTIWMTATIDNISYRFNIRLYGIDSPELKPKEGTIEEKHRESVYANISKSKLSELILDKIVKVSILNQTKINNRLINEKYGRLLCNVYIKHHGQLISVNKWMLDNKYAIEYDGGRKKKWNSTK